MKIIFLFILLLLVFNVKVNSQTINSPFTVENDSAVPGLLIQNLPASQMHFREKTALSIAEDISVAAKSALLTYSDDIKKIEQAGWIQVSIPRKNRFFNSQESIVLLRFDKERETVEIAVRGTENLDDTLIDLDAKATFDSVLGFPLHKGFQLIAIEILDTLKEKYLPAEVLKDYSFKLYGHSLGGAVAAIISMKLHQEGVRVDKVITFGAPRFTTNEGARKFQVLNQVTYRIVRCDDVVPFLPPPNFFGWTTESYQANGNILLLLAPPYFDYSIGIDIERDFAYQLRIELENLSNRDLLAFGHRMSNYEDLMFWFGPSGLQIQTSSARHKRTIPSKEMIKLRPVFYSLNLRDRLCPAKLEY